MFQVHSKVIQLYKYPYIIFQIINRLLEDIDYGYLCSTINLCCLLHIYLIIRNLAFYSNKIKQVESNVTIFYLGKNSCFLKYYIIYIYIYIYVYKSFSTTLDEGLRKNIKQKEKEKLENIN